MKAIRALAALSFLSIELALPSTAHCQTYSYSGPVRGGFEMYVWDQNMLFSGGNFFGGTFCNFNTLTETVYLDPVAHTIRQVGFISVTPSGGTWILDDSRHAGGITIPASLTLNLSVSGGGISFDTGTCPYRTFGDGYDITSEQGITDPQFIGSYSWTTGDQTYTGPLNYQLGFGAVPYDRFSIPDQTSLILMNPSCVGAIGIGLADVNAANGIELNLVTGGNDHASHFFWDATPITTMAVPEPGCISLFSLGFGALLLLQHRPLPSRLVL